MIMVNTMSLYLREMLLNKYEIIEMFLFFPKKNLRLLRQKYAKVFYENHYIS